MGAERTETITITFLSKNHEERYITPHYSEHFARNLPERAHAHAYTWTENTRYWNFSELGHATTQISSFFKGNTTHPLSARSDVLRTTPPEQLRKETF